MSEVICLQCAPAVVHVHIYKTRHNIHDSKMVNLFQSEYTSLLPHLDEGVLGTAMQGVGCFNKLIFSWVNPLLEKGINTTEVFHI